MKLSTRARYGLRAMIVLAENFDKRPILLKEIAKEEGLSMKYLDHILRPLKAKNLVRRVHNGYVLTKKPRNISSYEIISTLERDNYPVECAMHPENCDKSKQCVTRELWKKINDSYKEILSKSTLADFINKKGEKNG